MRNTLSSLSQKCVPIRSDLLKSQGVAKCHPQTFLQALDLQGKINAFSY